MNKAEFLKELAADLHRMQDAEKNKFTNYYEEMIADYTENGISEEDAVKKIGDPKKIAEELLNEYDSIQIKLPSTGSKILNAALIIIGFPLWGSILLAVVLMILSAYILLWCIPFITGVGCIGLFTSSLIGIIGSPFIMARGISAGIMQLGAGVALTGISILLGMVTIILSKKFVIITKNFSNRMISLFRRKVVAQR